MELIKIRTESEVVTISVTDAKTLKEKRIRAKKINKYKRIINKLFK